jgi:NADH-quinone oxidoreductase subunit G
VMPECNSLGLAMIGGMPLEDVSAQLASDKADTVIVLENDLFRRASEGLVVELFSRAANVIVMDHLVNRTTEKAQVVLPVGTFAESTGTYVSSEGRAQRFYRVMSPAEEVLDGWKWIRELLEAIGRPEARGWKNSDDLLTALSAHSRDFRGISGVTPSAEFRIKGQRIPRQSHRYSGRTATAANVTLHEPAPPKDADSPLAFSMEGFGGQPPSGLVTRFWAPGWNSIQAVNKFQSEIAGQLRGGDPGLRLLEALEHPTGTHYFTDVPSRFCPKERELLVVPLFQVFGSEELSSRSPAIAERAPEPHVAVNPADAEAFGAADGEKVILTVNGHEQMLIARVMPGIARGLACVTVGLNGSAGLDLPIWGRVAKVS